MGTAGDRQHACMDPDLNSSTAGGQTTRSGRHHDLMAMDPHKHPYSEGANDPNEPSSHVSHGGEGG